jgi:hypothetical protein
LSRRNCLFCGIFLPSQLGTELKICPARLLKRTELKICPTR